MLRCAASVSTGGDVECVRASLRALAKLCEADPSLTSRMRDDHRDLVVLALAAATRGKASATTDSSGRIYILYRAMPPSAGESESHIYLRRLDALVCDVGVGYLTGALFDPFHQVAQLWPLSPDIRADPMAPIAPKHAAVFFTAEAVWDQ